MLITKDLLSAGTGAPQQKIDMWLSVIQRSCDKFNINSVNRVAAFLSQIGVESFKLKNLEENLNYSAQRLVQVWPTRFTEVSSQQYANNPTKLANYVYALRNGNGDVNSGDGYKYRGRGLIQVTFKNNYLACGKGLSLTLVDNPDLLLDPQNASDSAAWFFNTNGCNELADVKNIIGVSGVVNRGNKNASPTSIAALNQRLLYFRNALNVKI